MVPLPQKGCEFGEINSQCEREALMVLMKATHRKTHIHNQISNTNVRASNHSICKISLDGNCIPKSKEMSFLRKIIHIDLCSNNDFCGNDIDSDLDVKVIHFGFNVRVVFDHGTTNLPVCPSMKRQNECKICKCKYMGTC